MSGNYYTRTVLINWGHDHELEVEVGAYPFTPARTNCLPENATPAEGGMEEILSVSVVKIFITDGERKEKARKLPAACVLKLEDDKDFRRAVEEAFDKAEQEDD